MSDVYMIRVSGEAQRTLAEDLIEKSKQQGAVSSDDNIIIVPERIEPLNRDEAVEYLEEMAATLDMTVVDNESG